MAPSTSGHCHYLEPLSELDSSLLFTSPESTVALVIPTATVGHTIPKPAALLLHDPHHCMETANHSWQMQAKGSPGTGGLPPLTDGLGGAGLVRTLTSSYQSNERSAE